MNIKEELKERLADCVEERNRIEKRLNLMDDYLRYLELQEEIREVDKAIKALEHSCSPQYYMNQMAQIRGQ